ncbi:hypothetical protein B0T25DRAFT_548335 [Lasiosphaeria hispida]|uniref:Uncharacterized protein n=1 Tax=Lasiosphaeria hispida TaxID=260671 RepID=A0AAJ0HF56_9PEZI|nr:hypothetical protein B0T25DRAFT_548335 [Lasiosphaeria hispida]
MPVIRAADIMNILAADTQDEQTIANYRDIASRVTREIRKRAEEVVCHVEDMVFAKGRTNLLQLPHLALARSAQPLNIEVHNNMAKTLFTWASEKGFTIERNMLKCNILWLQGGVIECDPDRVVLLIFVRRPRRRDDGGVIEDAQGTTAGITVSEEPLSRGFLKSPTAESSFECQVGDMIVLEEGEQISVRREASVKEGTGPRDFCMFCIAHRKIPTGGAGEGGTA